LQRLIQAVQEALQRKNRYQRLADTLSAWFLPFVVTSAVIAFGLNWWWHDLPAALLAALAVVVMACPCALGLATPMALWSAVGKLAGGQVLVRDSDALLRLADARVIACDKTGTLTDGARVAEWRAVAGSEEQVLRIASALAAGSNHPLSQAIVVLGEKSLATCSFDVRSVVGRGVVAETTEVGTAYLGSERWLLEVGCQWPANSDLQQFAEQPLPLVCVGWQGEIRGVFALEESLRENAAEVIRWLRQDGSHVVILTGDRQQRAAAVAQQLQADVQAELLPAAKLQAIQKLRAHGPVVMLGDGINDAPALAEADVGIALGCGADVSRWTAGLCLLGNDLSRVPWVLLLSRRTVATIRWNLFWAFIYNACGIPLAALGLLHPVLAAAAMVVSSLLVVSNSLRLGQEEGPGEGIGLGKEGRRTETAYHPIPAAPQPQPHP
jgi:heavy metal translocating P-type ATPase